MSNVYGRRLRVLLLVARFYGLILTFLVVPVAALVISVVEFPTAPWFMLLAALVPYGVVGLFLLRAALPKTLTVQPNGIPLNETDAPALFELCRSAAHGAQFGRPFSVYVDLSPGPSSLRYLGFAGMRSRYAIVLGLPALQVLDEAELRVVVAYLFAIVGLEKLPEIWLKETRQIVSRALEILKQRRTDQSWLGRMLTTYVQRADALLAAQSTEAERAVAAPLGPLRDRLGACAQLFNRFWMNDVNPLLQRGFIPPITDGFLRILQKEGMLGSVPVTGAAISLLRSSWHIEQRIAVALGETHGTAIQQVSWELVPWRVILPSWEDEVQPYLAVLSGIHVRDVAPYAEHRLLELGRKLFHSPGSLPAPEQLRWKAARTLAVALALTLRRTGWQLAYEGAGDAWEFRRGLRSLNPFETLDLLASKRMLPEEWNRLCDDLGIGNLPLAAA